MQNPNKPNNVAVRVTLPRLPIVGEVFRGLPGHNNSFLLEKNDEREASESQGIIRPSDFNQINVVTEQTELESDRTNLLDESRATEEDGARISDELNNSQGDQPLAEPARTSGESDITQRPEINIGTTNFRVNPETNLLTPAVLIPPNILPPDTPSKEDHFIRQNHPPFQPNDSSSNQLPTGVSQSSHQIAFPQNTQHVGVLHNNELNHNLQPNEVSSYTNLTNEVHHEPQSIDSRHNNHLNQDVQRADLTRSADVRQDISATDSGHNTNIHENTQGGDLMHNAEQIHSTQIHKTVHVTESGHTIEQGHNNQQIVISHSTAHPEESQNIKLHHTVTHIADNTEHVGLRQTNAASNPITTVTDESVNLLTPGLQTVNNLPTKQVVTTNNRQINNLPVQTVVTNNRPAGYLPTQTVLITGNRQTAYQSSPGVVSTSNTETGQLPAQQVVLTTKNKQTGYLPAQVVRSANDKQTVYLSTVTAPVTAVVTQPTVQVRTEPTRAAIVPSPASTVILRETETITVAASPAHGESKNAKITQDHLPATQQIQQRPTLYVGQPTHHVAIIQQTEPGMFMTVQTEYINKIPYLICICLTVY